MSEIVKTMKLHIHVNETEAKSLEELTACYAQHVHLFQSMYLIMALS